MSYKLNIFYPFDKGFFGKTLLSYKHNNVKMTNASELKLDSVDDMVQYFKTQCRKNSLERHQNHDSYVSSQPVSISDEEFAKFIF